MVLDEPGVLADVVLAQLLYLLADHAVVRPQTGFAIADQTLVGVDADQQIATDQKGSDFDDFHIYFSMNEAR